VKGVMGKRSRYWYTFDYPLGKKRGGRTGGGSFFGFVANREERKKERGSFTDTCGPRLSTEEGGGGKKRDKGVELAHNIALLI